ncbi:MAG: histidine kinase [Ramlibacter sp.]|nr:histidine kinase [Ramlibacter sp.]
MHSLPGEPTAPLETRSVFQTLPDPAFRLDRRGTILDLNAAAQAELQPGGASLIGRPIQDTRLKDIAQQVPAALERIASDGATLTIEYCVDPPATQTHYEVRLSALPAQEILVLIRDITARKLAEYALRESDAQFRVISENITDAFWIRSPDMREVRYVSPAFQRIWGRPAKTLYGAPHKWVEFIVPEDREHVVRTFSALTTVARSLDVEYRIERPDGERRWVRVRGFQVRDAEDKLICHAGIVTDTTERKLAHAELDATHKQLMEASRRAGMAEIATNVLHNVGNILNSVTVSAGLARSALGTSQAQGLRRAVQMLDEHAGDLGSFLTQDDKGRMLPGYLSDISKALLQEQQEMSEELEHLTRSIDHIREVVTTQQSYAGKAGLVAPARIGDLVEDALRINGDALERDGVTVIREIGAVPRARLDRSRILQILVNLIGNAREALQEMPPESRRVTVSAEVADGGRLRICVKDEGEGISEDVRTRIFAHGFTTRKHGHGFGLHSCVQAAGEMGGSLTVRSDGPGKGATFILEVPLDPAEPKA